MKLEIGLLLPHKHLMQIAFLPAETTYQVPEARACMPHLLLAFATKIFSQICPYFKEAIFWSFIQGLLQIHTKY